MSDRVLKLAVLVAGVGLLSFQVWAKPRPTDEEIDHFARSFTDATDWVGRVAPDFELTLLDGSTFRLAERVGTQVIILNFFTTWCGPCRAEMPELERYQKAQGSNVLLLGIDVEEKHTVVEPFVASMKLTFPVGIDGAGDVSKLYGVGGFPTTVVIGVDGRVKLYESGAIANADVAFGPIVTPELAARSEGRATTRDAYLAALAVAGNDQDGPAPLMGRGRRIAEAMPCPCGCSDKVMACSCSTANGIKARLAAGVPDAKSDAEVMEELNREFCMKGM
jgi:thiol-disulfide isomerase/thioredoxin